MRQGTGTGRAMPAAPIARHRPAPAPIRPRRVGLAALAAFLLWPGPPGAAAPTWPERKCELYRAAWARYGTLPGRRDLGPAFVARHDAFLASGCRGAHDVCPTSPREIEAANDLTILAMNNGMASTFPPFGCPR